MTSVTEKDLQRVQIIFEYFRLNYEYFMRGMSEKEENAKKMQWISELKTFGHETVDVAMKKSLRSYPNKAPTVGQFVEVCKANTKQHYTPSARQLEVKKNFNSPNYLAFKKLVNNSKRGN